MPSFFRTAEDVRIYFLGLTNTPERKKQHRRLDTIYRQCVRRAGTKGNFFFHRRCATIKGRPILILEPQGPIDRGVFQEGITRFGETLWGRFRCPRPGYIILVVDKAVTPANAAKYSRLIRKLIAQLTGLMTSGGDDRVIIRTAAQDARMAKAEAAEREETARQELETARRLLAESPPPDPAVVAAQQQHAVQTLRHTWLGQVSDFRVADLQLQSLNIERTELSAPVNAQQADNDALRELRQHLSRLKEPEELQALLVDLEGDPRYDPLKGATTDTEDPLAAAQRCLDALQRESDEQLAALQPQIDRLREINQQVADRRQQMDQARRKIINDQAEDVREQIRQLQANGADLSEAQARLALVNRLQRADGSMRWIERSLQRMADAEQTDADAFARQVRLDSTLRQSILQLRQDVKVFDAQGATDLLDTLWHQRPGIAWAKEMVESMLRQT